MKISEMQKEAHEIAVAHGWWEVPRTRIELCALVHTEVSEAVEAYRDDAPNSVDEKGKPIGFASELADVIIRVGDMAEAYGIDLEAEIRRKMDYNKTRSWRHGGKRA